MIHFPYLVSLLTMSGMLVTVTQGASIRALIFSRTADFRHDSIPTAVNALITHGASAGVEFDATEDNSTFTDDGLSPYAGLVFLMNTGEGTS